MDLKCSICPPSVNSNYTNMYTQWRVPRKQGTVSNPNPKNGAFLLRYASPCALRRSLQSCDRTSTHNRCMQLQEGPLAALSMAIRKGVVGGDNVDLRGHLKGQAVGGWEGNLQGTGTGSRCRCKVSACMDVSRAPTWMCRCPHLDASAHPPGWIGTPTWM